MQKDDRLKLEKIMTIRAFMQRAPKIIHDYDGDAVFVQIETKHVWWLIETLERELRRDEDGD